jgi:hypothetical protein
MSRIGKNPVSIPQGVTITLGKDNVVTVKGPKGELKESIDRDISFYLNEFYRAPNLWGGESKVRPTQRIPIPNRKVP